MKSGLRYAVMDVDDLVLYDSFTRKGAIMFAEAMRRKDIKCYVKDFYTNLIINS